MHRIGRTARGGAKGTAYTFLTPVNLNSTFAMTQLVGILERCGQDIPTELAVSFVVCY